MSERLGKQTQHTSTRFDPTTVYPNPRLCSSPTISPLTLIHPEVDPPPCYTLSVSGHTLHTSRPPTADLRRSGLRDCPTARQDLSPNTARPPLSPAPRRSPRTRTRSRSSASTHAPPLPSTASVPRSLSSPLLRPANTICALPVGMSMSMTYTPQPPPYPWSSSEDDDSVTETEERQRSRETDTVYTPWGASGSNGVRHRKSTPNLRARGGMRGHEGYGVVKSITTAPGVHGAGETETEGDDISHLPNTRIVPQSPSSSTPLEILYEIACWLSIVPAVFGTIWNFLHIVGLIEFSGGGGSKRVDHGVAMIWAILTGHLHHALTLNLLSRWRIYYSPLPTLIRLLAFQTICWPATHFTLTLVDHIKRPMACWAVVGTTTAVSRAIGMWVVSNLPGAAGADGKDSRRGRRWDARLGVEGLGERRWDWGRVGLKCAFPVGVLYFIMAWASVLKTELWGC